MIDWLGSLPPGLIIATIALMILAESGLVVGMVLPGTTAVLAMGVFAGLGVVPATPAYLAAALAATAGPSVGWYLGSRSGHAIKTSAMGRFVGDERWTTAEQVIERRGSAAVFFAQYIVIARTLVPPLAGMSGLTYRRFAPVSVPAAVFWAAGLTLAGQLAGASYSVVVDDMGSAGVLLAVAGGLSLVLIWIGRSAAGDPAWEARWGERRTTKAFRATRHRVEDRILAKVGPRAAPFVSALVWWVMAVLLGAATTVALVWATNQSPFRRLDEPLEEALAQGLPGWIADGAAVVATVLTPATVLRTFYLVVGVTLFRERATISRARRTRLVIATLGLAALAVSTTSVADLMRRRSDGAEAFELHMELAVIPCALALAALITAVGADHRRRIAHQVVVAIAIVVMVTASLIRGTTVGEAVVGLAVAAVWTLLLAAAANLTHTSDPAQHQVAAVDRAEATL